MKTSSDVLHTVCYARADTRALASGVELDRPLPHGMRASRRDPRAGTAAGAARARWWGGIGALVAGLIKQDELQQVTVGWTVKWQKGQTTVCDFRLRQREYGDRGLATWCVVEKTLVALYKIYRSSRSRAGHE